MSDSIQNVLLISPKQKKEILYKGGFPLPPIGICYLASSLRNQGYNVHLVDEFCEELPDMNNFDVVCCSAMTTTANRAYDILDRARALGKFTAIGGPHASSLPGEAKEHADFVAVGEGERVFPEVLEKKEKGIFRAGPVRDLNRLAFPALDLYERNDYLADFGISTSRGCPYDCTFCAVHNVHSRGYRTRSVENIIKELKTAEEKLGKIRVFGFYDDNLTLDKSRMKKLFTEMTKEGITPKSAAQVRLDMAEDEKLLKSAVDAGFCGALVGFESISNEVLEKDYNKKQSVDNIKKAIKVFHDYGIFVYGMFIFGADHDDKKIFDKTLEFANQMDIDFVQGSILTPLPGTGLFEKLRSENRIINFNWDYYDCAHCVFEPKNMSKEELETGILDFWHDFYGWRRSIPKIMKLIAGRELPAAYIYWKLKREVDSLGYEFFE